MRAPFTSRPGHPGRESLGHPGQKAPDTPRPESLGHSGQKAWGTPAGKARLPHPVGFNSPIPPGSA